MDLERQTRDLKKDLSTEQLKQENICLHKMREEEKLKHATTQKLQEACTRNITQCIRECRQQASQTPATVSPKQISESSVKVVNEIKLCQKEVHSLLKDKHNVDLLLNSANAKLDQEKKDCYNALLRKADESKDEHKKIKQQLGKKEKDYDKLVERHKKFEEKIKHLKGNLTEAKENITRLEDENYIIRDHASLERQLRINDTNHMRVLETEMKNLNHTHDLMKNMTTRWATLYEECNNKKESFNYNNAASGAKEIALKNEIIIETNKTKECLRNQNGLLTSYATCQTKIIKYQQEVHNLTEMNNVLGLHKNNVSVSHFQCRRSLSLCTKLRTNSKKERNSLYDEVHQLRKSTSLQTHLWNRTKNNLGSALKKIDLLNTDIHKLTQEKEAVRASLNHMMELETEREKKMATLEQRLREQDSATISQKYQLETLSKQNEALKKNYVKVTENNYELREELYASKHELEIRKRQGLECVDKLDKLEDRLLSNGGLHECMENLSYCKKRFRSISSKAYGLISDCSSCYEKHQQKLEEKNTTSGKKKMNK